MLCRLSRRRGAFTWVELLVVLAIIAILISLLLPKVCILRCGSTRIRCSNNLRQIGIAVLHCYDTEGSTLLRAGTISNPEMAPEKRFSWFTALLPFVEEDSLYKDLDLSVAWDTERNQLPVGRVVPVFICPSGPRWSPPIAGALTHYVGIAGVGPDAATLPANDPRAGFFGYDRSITVKDIKDGTGNTLMVLETARDNGPWAAGGPASVRGLDPATQPYLGRHRPFGIKHGSTNRRERVGANALMVDASVRYLNGRTSAQVLEAMATIAGGEEIGPEY